MGSKRASQRRSRDEARKAILQDWADVRRWIDQLQQEWAERQQRAAQDSHSYPEEQQKVESD